MTKIVGVRFRTAGKVYYFDPKNLEIRRGQHVIVETSRGVEYGHVVVGAREVAKEEVVQPLKPVIRISTPEDDERVRRNRDKEREAMKICKEKIQKHNLEMKLIDAEYTFDNNKILFYFTADGRVDFRELVKDLAVVFKMRIELRQIGVRDETKILGSVGICGRPLCCHTFLSDFAPVSIKMAKEQNLSLNPAKISGVCGRLMCCLKNEQETYEYLNSRMPKRGDQVTMEDGRTGAVHSVNVMRQTVRVLIEENDEKEILELPVAELTFRPRKKKGADRETESGQPENGGSAEESGKEKKQNRNRRQEKEKNREQGGKKDREKNRETGQKTRDKDRRQNSPQERGETQDSEQNHRHGNRERNESQEPEDVRERGQNQRRGNRERNRGQEQEGEGQREERRRENRNRRRDRSRNRNRNGQEESRLNSEGQTRTENHPGSEEQSRTEKHPTGEGQTRTESHPTGEEPTRAESHPAGEGQARSDDPSQGNAEQ